MGPVSVQGKLCLSILILCLGSPVLAQTYRSAVDLDTLRFQVWTYREEVPIPDGSDPAWPRDPSLRSPAIFGSESRESPAPQGILQTWQEDEATASSFLEAMARPSPFETTGPSGGSALEQELLARRVLELARYTASGMLYGFVFEYRPSDRARNVEEYFSLVPERIIDWGDSRLRISQDLGDWLRMDLEFAYDLSTQQRSFRQAWLAASVPDAQGRGRASILLDAAGYLEAIEDAVRVGIRSHAQGLTQDKPALVSGRILFREAPRVIVDSGDYQAQASFKIMVEEIKHYRVF